VNARGADLARWVLLTPESRHLPERFVGGLEIECRNAGLCSPAECSRCVGIRKGQQDVREAIARGWTQSGAAFDQVCVSCPVCLVLEASPASAHTCRACGWKDSEA
jgi:hypothetical protein